MTILLVPVPEIFPGLIIHVPVAGKPLNTTLPVESAQVGWVIAPVVGAAGGDGSALTVKFAAEEIQVGEAINLALTVRLPGETPGKVVLA